MMLSGTLIVRRIPKPKLKRIGALPETRNKIEDIRTRSSKKRSSLSMAVGWFIAQMMEVGW